MALTVQKYFVRLALVLTLGLVSCSPQGQNNAVILARINDFELSLEDFQLQFSEEVEFDTDFKATPEAKKAFLKELIRKELLIQEAKKLKLDTKEQFMRTIQRYWESTLIRNLLNLQGQDMAQKIVVSEDEIMTRYEDMTQSEPSMGPLSEYRDPIIAKLKEEKRTTKLQHWMNELEEKAHVEINEELL